MKRYLVAAAAAVLLFASFGSEAQNPGGEPAYREAKIRDNAYITAPVPAWVVPHPIPDTKMTGAAVIRLSEAQFMVGSVRETFVRRVFQIKDSSALNEFGQLSIDFAPEYQTLALNSLRIIRNGTTIDKRNTVPVRFLQRETGLEQGVYNGIISASFLIDDLRVDDIVELAYTVTGSNPVFGNKFFDSASWTQSLPNEVRHVVVNYPANRNIRYRFLGLPAGQAAPQPAKTHNGDMIRLAFEQHQIPATAIETLIPVGYDPLSWLEFSEYGSWKEVAEWAANLFTDTSTAAGITPEMAGIPSSATTEEKVSKALQYVQNEIRYFSIALGENSHRPAQPSVTMQRRFGDCKDKSLLLTSLLKQLGIKATPVLVSTFRRNNVHSLLPSPSAFDHAIVQVEVNGKQYYLDPTRVGQVGKLEMMGQPLAGAEVLVADAKTSDLSVIDNTQTLSKIPGTVLAESMTITDFNKPAVFESRYTLTGKDAELVRFIRMRFPEQYNKALFEDTTRRYPMARRAADPVFKDDQEENQIEIVQRYTIDKAAESDRGGWYVKYLPANMFGVLKRPDSIDRKTPLAIPAFPFHARYSFEVTLPENVSVIVDPQSRQVSNRYFKLQAAEKFRGNVSRFDAELRIVADSVPPSALQDFAQGLRETNNLIRGYVWIPESSIKRTGLFESAEEAFIRKMQNRVEDEIAAYTKVIKSGKLSGKDLAMAYMERGLAYSNADKTTEALADMLQAIKLDNTNPDFHLDTSIVYQKRGDYKNSLEQINKAMVLGHDPERIYYVRGQNYYQMGKYKEALDDFSRIALSEEQTGSKPYVTLWYLWTLGHMGQPVPPNVKTNLDKEVRGEWPRPALGMFTGATTPEQVLAEVNKLQGDERLMALCEAYFYIGQYYLVNKDIAKAKEYFEKTKQTKITLYTEYSAAEYELKKLAKN